MTAVKAELPHGEFLPWVKAEFDMSQPLAYNFMQAHERFGAETYNNYKFTFSPTVLYALAAPSTPETVIDKAVAKTEFGEKVTVADVNKPPNH